MSNSTEIHQIRGNGRCAVRWMDGWINEQMGGVGEGRGGEEWGGVMFHAADRRRMTNAPLCSCPR